MCVCIHTYIYICLYIYIHTYTHYVKVVLSYWSDLCSSADVKDLCCQLSPTNDSTFLLTEDLSLSSRDSIKFCLRTLFQISVIFGFFFFFDVVCHCYCVFVLFVFFDKLSAFIQALDLAVWTLRFNGNLPQPQWMCRGKDSPGLLPSRCAHDYLTCGGTGGFWSLKRSGAALPQMSRNVSRSLVLAEAKRKKKDYGKEYPTYSTSNLKLMFYLKITMLMLSLLLFVVCLFIA